MKKPRSIKRINSGNGRLIILAIFSSMILFLARFGYDYGFSDQDEFLPLLIRFIDSTAFSGDWFVNAQLDGFNIRLPLILTLLPLAIFVGIPATVLIVYLVSFSLLVWAVFRIGMALNGNAPAAVISAILTVSVTTLWTLGGNDIVTGMLVPSQLAWMFGLWGLVWTLEGRSIAPGILCGLAVVYQPLVGIHLTVLCTVARLLRTWGSYRSRSFWSATKMAVLSAVWLPATAAVTASPVLAALIFEQMHNTISAESIAILTQFRAPHHFIPSAFNPTMSTRFLVLFGLGGLSIWLFRGRFQPKMRFVLVGLILICATLLALGFANAYWIHLDFITKLQLFKFSVSIKLFMVAAIVTCIFSVMPKSILERIGRIFSHPVTIIIVTAGLAVLVGHGIRSENWTYRTIPTIFRGSAYNEFVQSDNQDARLFDWVQRNTPASAIFAIPPDYSGFQTATRRAQFVSFKAFPYHEDDIKEWYRRLLVQTRYDTFEPGIGGVILPKVRGVEAMKQFTSYHESLSAEALVDFARSESVDYVLRRTQVSPAAAENMLTEVYRNDNWIIYGVRKSIKN